MPTRRQTLAGVMALGFGSAAASASAFTSSSESQSDLRVVVDSDLRLVPAREDTSEYFELDSEGEIEALVFDQLNKRALTEFADLASIVNNGDLTADQIELSFTTDGADGEVTNALKIVGDDVSGDDGGPYTLLPPDETLGPGDSVTFGIEMDFLPDDGSNAVPDSDEAISVTLVVDPIRA